MFNASCEDKQVHASLHVCRGPSLRCLHRTNGGNRHAVLLNECGGGLWVVAWQGTACVALWLELLVGHWGRDDNCQIVGLQNKAGARGAACGGIHLSNQSQTQRGVDPACHTVGSKYALCMRFQLQSFDLAAVLSVLGAWARSRSNVFT